jgi:hypothetical protein
MGGVQMLFRVGLGAGALGMGGLAAWVNNHGPLHPGIGGLDVKVDGNQVGMFAGGVIILIGAIAASGVLREHRPLRKRQQD